jgi:FAD-dependent monooxygenase
LAAVLSGYGGPSLLQSYRVERRPVAARNIEHSGVHWQVHAVYKDLVNQTGEAVISKTAEGDSIRARIAEHMTLFDGENKDHGFELGYRYNGSPVVVPDQDGVKEPEWDKRHDIPHVVLKDGNTSIFDVFGTGRQYTLIDFSSDARYAQILRGHG